jgi:hypothetical protein
VEICDGVDNDCDGTIDEELTRPCQTACGVGIEHCNFGEWVGCDAPYPVPEICDGLDNNCDGMADENCSCVLGEVTTCKQDVICGPVTTGPCAGVPAGTPVNCGVGIALCDENGEWSRCEYFMDELETCNGWDDDCDGTIDGMSTPCGNIALHGIGECRTGTSSCTAGIWGECVGERS